jgi:hypothetical protein
MPVFAGWLVDLTADPATPMFFGALTLVVAIGLLAALRLVQGRTDPSAQ